MRSSLAITDSNQVFAFLGKLIKKAGRGVRRTIRSLKQLLPWTR